MNSIFRFILTNCLLGILFPLISTISAEEMPKPPTTETASAETETPELPKPDTVSPKDQKAAESSAPNENQPPQPKAEDANSFDISVFESDDQFQPKNEIDTAVLEDLNQKKIKPARLSSDSVFLRRVFLDVTGRIPTIDETRKFLKDSSPDKRSRLIDELLESPDFADYWTMRWADFLRVKAEFPINLWPHGASVYYQWLHDSIYRNVRYDQFARALLMGQGSNFRSPASNFYRAVERKEPVELASVAVLTFLGERTDLWPKEKRDQVTIFFSRVQFKGSAQWKEEIVFWDSTPLESPEVTFPDGTKGTVRENQDPREVFADWLIRPENHAFNHQIVNRLWFWLTGVGIIDPPDDLRQLYANCEPPAYPGGKNPPVNAALLNILEKKLLDSGYDLKEVIRFILNSRTYQQSSIPCVTENSAQSTEDKSLMTETAIKNLALYPVRRLEAEVLQDIFRDLFSVSIRYVSEVPEPFAYVPDRIKTVSLYDSGLTNSFLEMFGRSTRDSGLTSDRNQNVNEAQQMFLMNSNEVNSWIGRKFIPRAKDIRQLKWKDPERFQRAVKDWGTNLWLSVLSRKPTETELERLTRLFENGDYADSVWLLINSREFLCQH